MAAIIDVAGKVPYGIVAECPDAHSANYRKKAATWELLPDNMLGVDSTCGAHQGHRVVDSCEKQIVGHVHAVHVTCSHYSNSSRISSAFLSLLEELDYHVGPPPGQFGSDHESIIEYTLLRRRCVVTCDALDPSELEYDKTSHDAVRNFLKFWNGDWTVPKCQHYCQGCCRDADDAKRNMFASAQSVNILQSKDMSGCSGSFLQSWVLCV